VYGDILFCVWPAVCVPERFRILVFHSNLVNNSFIHSRPLLSCVLYFEMILNFLVIEGPIDVTFGILGNWIEINDVAVLDSSICSSKIRDAFLDVLIDPRFYHTTKESKCYFSLNYQFWILSRHIKLRSFRFPANILLNFSDELANYFRSLSFIDNLELPLSADVLLLFKACRHVKNLTLSCCHKSQVVSSTWSMDEILSEVKDVEFLKLVNCKMTLETCRIIVKTCPGLISLDCGYPFVHKNFPLEGLFEIARNFPKMTRFLIPLNSAVFNDDALTFVSSCWPLLTFLDFTGSQTITDKGLISLTENCPLLEHLNISNFQQLSDVGLSSIGKNCPNLTELYARECNIGDLSITAIALNCPKFKSIYLANNDFVTDSSLCELAKHCPQMTNLVLDSCTLVSDKSIISFAECCPLLDFIDLNGCDITEYCLYELLDHCKNITYLTAHEAITTGLMLKAVKNAKSIEFLTFLEDDVLYFRFHRDLSTPTVTCGSGYSNLVKYLNTIAYLCPDLQEFIFDGYRDPEIVVRPTFFSLCPNLLVIKLQNIVYSPGTITTIADDCVNITTIHLFGIKFPFGDEFVNLVTLRGRSITNISLIGCAALDANVIYSLVDNCTNLTYLDLSGVLSAAHTVTVMYILSNCQKLGFLGLNNLPALSDRIADLIPANRYITVQQEAYEEDVSC
jgi:hypothetical protein